MRKNRQETKWCSPGTYIVQVLACDLHKVSQNVSQYLEVSTRERSVGTRNMKLDGSSSFADYLPLRLTGTKQAFAFVPFRTHP
jgi:hypothetical protein